MIRHDDISPNEPEGGFGPNIQEEPATMFIGKTPPSLMRTDRQEDNRRAVEGVVDAVREFLAAWERERAGILSGVGGGGWVRFAGTLALLWLAFPVSFPFRFLVHISTF
jgi:hypothetical protein